MFESPSPSSFLGPDFGADKEPPPLPQLRLRCSFLATSHIGNAQTEIHEYNRGSGLKFWHGLSSDFGL
jgi:hypothetical protein